VTLISDRQLFVTGSPKAELHREGSLEQAELSAGGCLLDNNKDS